MNWGEIVRILIEDWGLLSVVVSLWEEYFSVSLDLSTPHCKFKHHEKPKQSF